MSSRGSAVMILERQENGAKSNSRKAQQSLILCLLSVSELVSQKSHSQREESTKKQNPFWNIKPALYPEASFGHSTCWGGWREHSSGNGG